MAARQLYHSHSIIHIDILTSFTGYMLLGLISSLVFRAIRDTLPNNPEAQERILGASMTALALADVSAMSSVQVFHRADRDAARSRSELVEHAVCLQVC